MWYLHLFSCPSHFFLSCVLCPHRQIFNSLYTFLKNETPEFTWISVVFPLMPSSRSRIPSRGQWCFNSAFTRLARARAVSHLYSWEICSSNANCWTRTNKTNLTSEPFAVRWAIPRFLRKTNKIMLWKGPINSVFLLGVFVYMHYSQARQGSGISFFIKYSEKN